MTEIAIRSYTAADLDTAIDIFQRAIRETASRDYSPAQVEVWSTVDREAFAGRRLSRPTWLALVGDQPAGFSDLEPDGHLDMLFVHPAFGGRGVARTLIATVEAAARMQGIERLRTEASITARPVFERYGFRVVEEEQVTRRGVVLSRYRMEKSL